MKFTGSSAVIFCMIILACESNSRPAEMEDCFKYMESYSIILLKFKHTQSSNISAHSMANHFNIQCIYPTIINQNFNHFGEMFTNRSNVIIEVWVYPSAFLPINSNQSDIFLIVIVTKKRWENRKDYYFWCRFKPINELPLRRVLVNVSSRKLPWMKNIVFCSEFHLKSIDPSGSPLNITGSCLFVKLNIS